jgi:hypothetical protein
VKVLLAQMVEKQEEVVVVIKTIAFILLIIPSFY